MKCSNQQTPTAVSAGARVRRLMLGLLAALLPASCGLGIAPPPQPATGPGSSAAVATGVRTTTLGEGGQKVFIYEPEGAEDLTVAPVVVFLHGYGGVNPMLYGAWIKHLVLRGNIVLFPVYQETLREPETYTPNLVAAVQAAYAELRGGGHIAPDETRLAVVGHSLGGTLSMNLAAVAHTSGLPAVRAILAANAGDASSVSANVPSLQTGNYEKIPADVLFLGVVGEEDDVVGDDIVLDLYSQLGQVPQANREVLRLHTDGHGWPALVADHRAPGAVDDAFDSGQKLTPKRRPLLGLLRGGKPNQPRTAEETVNAFDYYGYWKWFDALTDAAFYGTHREYALGNTEEQTSLGTWADGVAVTPATRIRPEAD